MVVSVYKVPVLLSGSMDSDSDEEYEPTERPRKSPAKLAKCCKHSESDFLSLEAELATSGGCIGVEGLSVLQCMAKGLQPPVTAEMLQHARETATASKKGNSSFLRYALHSTLHQKAQDDQGLW